MYEWLKLNPLTIWQPYSASGYLVRDNARRPRVSSESHHTLDGCGWVERVYEAIGQISLD